MLPRAFSRIAHARPAPISSLRSYPCSFTAIPRRNASSLVTRLAGSSPPIRHLQPRSRNVRLVSSQRGRPSTPKDKAESSLDAHAPYTHTSQAQLLEELEKRRIFLADLEERAEIAQSSGDKETVLGVRDLSEVVREQIRDLEQKVKEFGEEARSKPENGETVFGDPAKPLPDLRQGIPSTFNMEFQSSDTSSSFKDRESPQPELNLTADPNVESGQRDDDVPRMQYESSTDRRRAAFARYMYIAAFTFGIVAFGYLGREWENESEAKKHPDAPSGLTPGAWYGRFRERLGGQFSHYTEPAFPKLLPDMPPEQRMPYTLVLSLEDLLVTSTWDRQNGYKIAKRPGVDYFLRYLCQYYELVIFTTVQMGNADLILRQLDPFGLALPIFRDGTHYINGEHVKDLSYLNRDLSKTIIIDTVPAHTRMQPENAIILPKWKGEKNDKHAADLVALIPFLEYTAGMELPDVRKVLTSYAGKHIPDEFHRREQKAREEFNKRRSAEMERRGKLPGAGMLGSLSSGLGFKAPTMVGIEQSPAEAFAAGMMLSDQIRERGRRNYLEMDKQIRENADTWLKQRKEEEQKAQEEGMRNLTSGMFGFIGGGNTEEKK